MSSTILIELAPALMVAGGMTIAAALITRLTQPYVSKHKARLEKASHSFKERVQKKIENGISLTATEIVDVGRGLRLSSGQSISALFELYATAEDKDKHQIYRSLIDDLNRAEPFETLPEELRPSLARLAALCEQSDNSTDKDLLVPLTKVLSEYQDMKRDHATIKKQGRVSYVVALISFFIGIVGLVLAFTGPSKQFIQTALGKTEKELVEHINSAQQGAAVDRSPTAERRPNGN